MKEKRNRRWGLKLLSLLCAFLFWLGVVNVADPIMTVTVEVPVEIENAEILTENNLTYEIASKRTATVSYEVKTTNAHRIRPSDFRAYADMTELWSVSGAIPIKVETLNHAEYLVSSPTSRTSVIKIKTEPLQRKPFEIEVRTAGTLEDGHELGEVTITPKWLYVEGPESLIGGISSVGVEIDMEGASADLEGTARPQYYDANGNKIQLSERIVSDCEEVTYHVPVRKVKSLTLDFQVSGEAASGYRFTGVVCDVRSVPVVGLKSALAGLHTITIPGEVLNVSGASANVVRTVNLDDYIPPEISLAGQGSHEIHITLTVEKLAERIFTVEVNDACYTGEDETYIYRAEPDELNIRVRALAEELDSLTLDSNDVTIDVSEMTEGRHEAYPALSLEAAYEIMSISPCTIHVLRIPDESESQDDDSEDGGNITSDSGPGGPGTGIAVSATSVAHSQEETKASEEETGESAEETEDSSSEESTEE